MFVQDLISWNQAEIIVETIYSANLQSELELEMSLNKKIEECSASVLIFCKEQQDRREGSAYVRCWMPFIPTGINKLWGELSLYHMIEP